MRLIDENGEQKGVMRTYDAIRMAEEAGLDLVEVSPNANPPVCKILDFGKYRYEMEKKQRDAKRNQTVIKVKEIRMQPKIDKHDLETKSKFISEFLQEGNKVKVSIRFRGREMAHPELGTAIMQRFTDSVAEYGSVEKQPKLEGRSMTMFVSAKPKSGK